MARRPYEHSLKTDAVYWDAIARGDKNFEVRHDDRGFQCGDVLLLRRLADDSRKDYAATDGGLTGVSYRARTIRARVAWILTGGQFGIAPGYIVMALADVIEE